MANKAHLPSLWPFLLPLRNFYFSLSKASQEADITQLKHVEHANGPAHDGLLSQWDLGEDMDPLMMLSWRFSLYFKSNKEYISN